MVELVLTLLEGLLRRVQLLLAVEIRSGVVPSGLIS